MATSQEQIPLSQYGLLSGELFLYANGRAAFETTWQATSNTPSGESGSSAPSYGSLLSSKKCILVCGLGDGLLPVPYTQLLADACREASWSLVQPIISSSYTGFGHGSLRRDCDELQELMLYLIKYRNAQEFCLVGHSTGCQDAIYFLQHADKDLRDRLKVVALQAPVSDREDAAQSHTYEENLKLATDLVKKGKGEEMMPRCTFWAPITANRFVDLQEWGGTDDYFSSDFSDEELQERLQHVSSKSSNSSSKKHPLKVLVAMSGEDEFVPSTVDSLTLMYRLVAAMNANCKENDPQVAEGLFLKTGNHNLSKGPEDGKQFVNKIMELIADL